MNFRGGRENFWQLFRRLLALAKSTQFWSLTIVGNSLILVFSLIFYQIENELNLSIHSWLDALWWAFVTVTTVGYGDIVPVTQAGKILAMILMLIGTGLFATYTALFANAMLGREFDMMDRKMRVIKRNVDGLKEEVNEEEEELLGLINGLKEQIDRLEKRINKK